MTKNTNVNVVQIGWLEKLKSFFDNILDKFDFSIQRLMILALYCGVGIFAGFLLKKFGKALIFGIILLGLAFWGLQYLEVITINFVKLKATLGLATSDTFEGFVRTYYEWIKVNLAISISALIGFFIGYKIG